MEGEYRDKYSFMGEWYDGQASLIRRFNVFFYPIDNTLEMYDPMNRKMFMRRIHVKGITLDRFYIGCTLNILGRLIHITDFGCEDTRRKLTTEMQLTFLFIKPMELKLAGKILTHIHKSGLQLTRMKKARLSSDDVHFFYRNNVNDPTVPFLLEHLTGSVVIGAQLVGKNAVKLCQDTLGDGDPSKAAPGTIRALYGIDPIKNCAHSSSTVESAIEDLDRFFRIPTTATLSNCTMCIVKPHAIREGKLGAIMEAIDEGDFNVTALNMMVVENVNAGEFYEVYKGIVPEYKGMVEELASGPCVAMEIVAKNKKLNSAVEFRKLVGPADPETARLLRPNTIRAKFGTNKVKNAVHCSDLPADGLLEVEYFFKILDLD